MDIGDKKEIFKLGLDINTSYYGLSTLNTLGGSGTFLPNFSNLFSYSSPMSNTGSMNFMGGNIMPGMFMPMPNFFKNMFSGLGSFSSSLWGGTKSFFKGTSHKFVKFSESCSNIISGIAKKLNCDAKHLKQVMYSESGGNAQAVNGSSGATGLIQFMPKTAQALGISQAQLASMSREQQLQYVEKYLTMQKKAAGLANDKLDVGTLYALVFAPAKAKQEILYTAGSAAYRANAALDIGHKGYITKTDLAQRAQSYNA